MPTIKTSKVEENMHPIDTWVVNDNGIHHYYLSNNTTSYSNIFIPRETFVEAFNKYIRPNTFGSWERRLP